MRLAFSTLGCPDATLEQLIEWAGEFGISGLELRADDAGLVSTRLRAEERRRIGQRLAEAQLTVLALASYVKVCAPADDDAVIAALRANLLLAADLGATGMRVFPGAGVDPLAGTDMVPFDQAGARRLSAVAAEAEALGVRLLLETHDSHPRGADVARVLERVSVPHSIGAIWDVMHPWRYGETPLETAQLLEPYFAYCQVKDGVIGAEPTDITLTLPGDGAVPLPDIISLVESLSAGQSKTDPWISLEWEKAWHPELPEMPIALAALRRVLRS